MRKTLTKIGDVCGDHVNRPFGLVAAKGWIMLNLRLAFLPRMSGSVRLKIVPE